MGLLGNVYSRKMGGTAFTSMVTGVLFLVPVSRGMLRLLYATCALILYLSRACRKRVVSPRKGTASILEAR